MNPRYAAWLATNPPVIKFYAFSAWINQRWAEYRKIHRIHPDTIATDAMHAGFDAWLKVPDEDEIYGICCSIAARRSQAVA